MKIKKYFIRLAILFILNAVQLIAQPLVVERLNTSDGLSNNQVHYIFQDSYGFLWIGTEYGLNRYDGYNFKIFKNDPGNPESINSNVIWWIVEDTERNLWISTGVGVAKYLRAENKFKNYDLGLGGSQYSSLATFIDSKGNIWATVEGENLRKYNKLADSWDEQTFVLLDSSKKYINPGHVGEITEDINKKLWIASLRYGLMWYDESENVFRQSDIMLENEGETFTTNENYMVSLYSDPSGVLWIATRNGVYKYDPALNKLKTIEKYITNKLSNWNDYNSITQDEKGNVWIANNIHGLLRFESISDDFNRIEISGQNYSRDERSDNILTRIFCDRTGVLWIGSMTKGIFKYDPNKNLFAHYKHNEKNKNSLSSSEIYSLLESKFYPGKIYIGTRGGGLNIFNTQTNNFSRIAFDVFEDFFGGSVRSILEEDDGSLWLGTWGDGLLKMDPHRKVVKRFNPDSTNMNCISDPFVRNLHKDSQGNLWIGTSGGLNYLDLKGNQFTNFSTDYTSYSQELIDFIKNKINLDLDKAKIVKVGNSKNLSAEFEIFKQGNYLIVTAGEASFDDFLMYDYGWIENNNEKIIWNSDKVELTSYNGGDGKNRVKIETILLNPGKYSLKYRSDDSHCFGYWNTAPPVVPEFWGIRIFNLDGKNEFDKIKKFLNDDGKKLIINGRYIRAVHLSDNDIIWVGASEYGLQKINMKDKNVKNYLLNDVNNTSLSNISVNDIYENKKGMLWIATDRGLTEFDPVKETFTTFTEEDGLPANDVMAILPGDNNELWLSTINGISKMTRDDNTKKAIFVNFGMDDGLGGMDFFTNVALKTDNGKYFFGGGHGLNEFTLKNSISSPPKLVLTDLQISNESVLSMKSNLLQEKTIYDLTDLSLSYSQNNLSFEFAALHFSNPKKNKYAHKLEGYEDDWIYDNRRIATYTNLDPGEYTFKFKGSNSEGIWDEESRSIALIVSPPFWQTWWAYSIYVICFVSILGGLRRVDLNRRKEKEEKRILELENERKSEEFEQARQLQLSMLPKDIPCLPNLDISVYMKTATEVGGDYYDFSTKDDGSLNIAIGDATGHGMKAGTLVSMMKSLFTANSINKEMKDFFTSSNIALKKSNMVRMMIGFAMLNIKGNKATLMNSGMPPIYHYKSELNSIVEIDLSGIPLGALFETNYRHYEILLNKNDILLLMSDGFPELINNENIMYGYERVKSAFQNVTDRSPEEIINYLRSEVTNWIKGKDLDDDVTFIVMKVM